MNFLSHSSTIYDNEAMDATQPFNWIRGNNLTLLSRFFPCLFKLLQMSVRPCIFLENYLFLCQNIGVKADFLWVFLVFVGILNHPKTRNC